jgi:predicted nucleic acid-binding protein
MPFVLDASVVACWAFQDEDHPRADLALARISTDEALVPTLWWFEVRNILVVNERRKRITEADTANFLKQISQLVIKTDRLPDESAVLRLSRTRRLTVYDASYLELAQREGVPLATLAVHLTRAARAEKVVVI